jgi:O-antigen/teichoic acid export membrane protein/SAM-dependent methyltransferase
MSRRVLQGTPPPPPPTETAADEALLTSERVRLIRDGLVNYAGILISGIVAIAVVPTMLSHLGAETYGLWVIVLAVVALVGEFDFGLGPILTREVAADSGSPEIWRLVVSAAAAYLALAAVGGVLVAAIGTAISDDLGLSQGAGGDAPFVFVMGGVLFFAGRGLAFSLALLYGWRRFAMANGLIAGLAAISGIGTVGILLGGGGIRAVAVWQAVAAGFVAAAAVASVMWSARGASFELERPSWAALRPQLRFGLASQILTVSINLLWVAAPTLVGSISGSRVVASYDVGRKFPLAVSTITWRSSEAFFPTASRESRGGTAGRRHGVLDAITRWNLVLVLPFAVVLSLLAPNLLDVWLDSPPPDATIVLRFLALAVFVDAFGVGALHVLWAAGRMRALLGILGATTAAGFGVAVVLLWQVGVAGIAIALAATMAIRSMLLLITVSREHGVSLSSLLVEAGRGLALPLAASAFATFFLRELIEPHGWVGLVTVGLSGLAVYLVALSLAGGREEEQAVLATVTRIPKSGFKRAYRRLRRALRRVGPLRSSWYLAHELARIAGPGARPTPSRLDREFAAKPDPWDYRREVEQDRYRAAIEMLDAARGKSRFERALEVGCAEGMFTELLVPRCETLTAVDISSIALDRAQARLPDSGAVRLQQWDLLRDPELGAFDLVVAMDVLDYLLRPSDLRRAQGTIQRMLAPGGHLLVSTVRQNEVFENAWWRRWIRRGRMINESFASLDGLRLVQSHATQTHTLTMYVQTDG